MRLTLLIALILPLLLLGCSEKKEAEEEVKLKMYDVRYKSFESQKEVLLEKYQSAPLVNELTFNNYRISVEVVAEGKRVEYGGKVYSAEFGKYNPSGEKGEKFIKISDANVLILRVKFEKSDESGVAPPQVNVRTNLFFILFGVPIPGYKEVTLTKVEPRIAFEDGFVAPWNFALESDKPCGFDTNTSVESYTSLCLFTYPSDKVPKEVVISVFPSGKLVKAAFQGLGYPIARVPLQ